MSFGFHRGVLKFDWVVDVFRKIPFLQQGGSYLGMIVTQDAVFALKEADALLFHALKHLFIPIREVLVKDNFTDGMQQPYCVADAGIFPGFLSQ